MIEYCQNQSLEPAEVARVFETPGIKLMPPIRNKVLDRKSSAVFSTSLGKKFLSSFCPRPALWPTTPRWGLRWLITPISFAANDDAAQPIGQPDALHCASHTSGRRLPRMLGSIPQGDNQRELINAGFSGWHNIPGRR